MPVHKGVKFQVIPRGDSWQYVVHVVEEGVKKRVRQSLPSEELAQDACKTVIDRSLEGHAAKSPTLAEFATPTLQKVYELVRDGRWKGTKGEVTAKKNAEDCIVALGGSKPIDRLTTQDIDRLIVTFKDREMEPATIRRKLAALSTIIKYALERHWIKAMPVIDRKAAGKERKRLRFLSVEEEADALKFLKEYACEKPGVGAKVADFITFLIDTGLRLGEAIHLRWAEVDGEKAIRLGFDNKGEEPRMVPLTDRVAAVVKDRRASRQSGEKRVWPDMTVDRVEWFWGLMRESLKLTDDPDFVIHACRHTFASRLAMQGVPINVIKELGGWKTLDMVLRYAHLMPEQKEAAIRKMQQWRKDGTTG